MATTSGSSANWSWRATTPPPRQDDARFVPDGVRSTDPPRFVEIKNYPDTPLHPTSNAGKAVDYLTAWLDQNRGTPSLELFTPDDGALSDRFVRLLAAAAARGVEITVNGEPLAT